jgi:dolichyl-phosphate-mannose-protein mannosyltransferase
MESSSAARFSTRRTLLVFALTFAVAILFRFAALDRIPPGVFSDEALNGNEGFRAQRTGDYRIFYSANNGREGLWINLIGLSESVFGLNQFGLRFCSAVVGSLTVLAVFLLARELFSLRAALFSAWLLATAFWHVALSRIALRAILVPFLLTISVLFLLQAIRVATEDRRALSAILAALGGLLYGLGFHSYIAYRFTPFVILAFLAIDYEARRRRKEPLRPWLRILALWSSAALLAALPIAVYFLHHPADFFTRANQVSIFSQPNPLAALGTGLVRSLAQFNFKGDCWWLVNIDCASVLILPVGLLFLIGIVLACRLALLHGVRAHQYWLLLIWFFVMLLPAVLAGGPSALRSIGTVPVVFLFAGIAAESVFARLQVSRVASALFLLALITTAAFEAYRYFAVWAPDSRAASEFDASKLEVGRFLNSLSPSTPRYLVVNRDDDDVPVPHTNSDGSEFPLPISGETVLFATDGHPLPTFLFDDDASDTDFVPGSVIVHLYSDPEFFRRLHAGGMRFRTGMFGNVRYAVVE